MSKQSAWRAKLRIRLLGGRSERLGWLPMAVIYVLLTGLGFVFLYPLLYMISASLMPMEDLISSSVKWIPRYFTLSNYDKAVSVLHFGEALWNSVCISGICAVLQTISCALMAYGLERYQVPGKPVIFGLVALTFIVPSYVTLIPKSLMFFGYGMKNTIWPSIIPAMLGQGLKSSVFVLIFYQTFRLNPKTMYEAAQIDGAGALRTFASIALPLCSATLIVSFLFSFVWYWNETYQSGIFYGEVIKTLPMRLKGFVNEFSAQNPVKNGSTDNRLNEGIRMAGTFLTIAPLIILYAFMQRKFIEGIERTGLTGE
ncbi:MAG: carbohydrate ABC transporter permease [Aristaeellaceae bacterium]